MRRRSRRAAGVGRSSWSPRKASLTASRRTLRDRTRSCIDTVRPSFSGRRGGGVAVASAAAMAAQPPPLCAAEGICHALSLACRRLAEHIGPNCVCCGGRGRAQAGLLCWASGRMGSDCGSCGHMLPADCLAPLPTSQPILFDGSAGMDCGHRCHAAFCGEARVRVAVRESAHRHACLRPMRSALTPTFPACIATGRHLVHVTAADRRVRGRQGASHGVIHGCAAAQLTCPAARAAARRPAPSLHGCGRAAASVHCAALTSITLSCVQMLCGHTWGPATE